MELLDPGEKREEVEEISNFHLEASSPPHHTVYSTWAPCKSIPVSQSCFHYTCHVARGLLLALPGRKQQEKSVGKGRAEPKPEDSFERALESWPGRGRSWLGVHLI